MKNMFKKSLVAAAVLGLSTAAVNAAEVTSPNPVVASAEYLSVVDAESVLTVSGLTIELGANYTQNDLIILTFTGDSLDATSLPSTATVGAGAATLGLISTSVNSSGHTEVVYRVTDQDQETLGESFTLNDLEFEAGSIGSGVNVSFRAETNTGLALDTGGDNRTAGMVLVGSQYVGFGGTSFDGIIDVGTGRTAFETANDDAEFSVAERTQYAQGTAAAANFTHSVTVASVDYELTGNFSWLLNEDGDAVNTDAASVAVGADCGIAEIDATTLSVACADGSGSVVDSTVTITPAAGNESVIPTQSFTAGATVNFASHADSGSSSFERAAGSWTLNGSEVKIPYMPYGANISQILVVTNRSTQTGDVSVTAIDEAGNEYDLGVVATSQAGTTMRITGQVWNALNDAGLDLMGGTKRLALEVVTNAPQNDVTVYSAYNVGGTGARLVVNEDNKD